MGLYYLHLTQGRRLAEILAYAALEFSVLSCLYFYYQVL